MGHSCLVALCATLICAWYTVDAYQALEWMEGPASDVKPFLAVPARGEFSSQNCVIFTISTCLGLGIT